MSRCCKIQAVGSSLVLLVVLAVPSAHSSISFSNPITYPAGSNPTQVITADFNGDGKLDMAVLNPAISPGNTGSVAILLGNGDGTFQAAKEVVVPSNPYFIAAADLDGDRKLDIAVVTAGD